MLIYDNRNKKNSITCGYCRHLGHNKRHCPTLRKHWEANKDKDYHSIDMYIEWDVSGTDFGGYWKWSDEEAGRQFDRHYDYIKGIMETSTATTTPKKRRASKCGFCGSKEHTRRTCSEMGAFVKILEETNKAYRKAFYETVFVEYGLGIGAFVEYRNYAYLERNKARHTSLIMDIDFDSISIGNTFSRWNEYHTKLKVIYRHDDRERDFGTDLFHDSDFPLLGRKGMRHLESHYDGITNVIVPAPSLPDKEWFLGQSPAFEWVVKKKKLEDLFCTYGSTIKRYHPDGEAIYREWRNKI